MRRDKRPRSNPHPPYLLIPRYTLCNSLAAPLKPFPSPTQDGCPFCYPLCERIFLLTPVLGLWVACAVPPGHALRVPTPKSPRGSTPTAELALMEALDSTRGDFDDAAAHCVTIVQGSLS